MDEIKGVRESCSGATHIPQTTKEIIISIRGDGFQVGLSISGARGNPVGPDFDVTTLRQWDGLKDIFI